MARGALKWVFTINTSEVISKGGIGVVASNGVMGGGAHLVSPPQRSYVSVVQAHNSGFADSVSIDSTAHT
eukprot:1602349-Amphidinium_carterae.1